MFCPDGVIPLDKERYMHIVDQYLSGRRDHAALFLHESIPAEEVFVKTDAAPHPVANPDGRPVLILAHPETWERMRRQYAK